MNTHSEKTPCQIALSVTTGPLIVGVVAAEHLGKALQDLGKASEEIFRGDRLPILPIRPVNNPNEE